MIWPWLLFDYYHPKSQKSRFVQCFQWLCNHSEKPGNLVENRITLENTSFYQLMPENSDRRHCSCQALSLCKKARRKLMHLSLRLAFARTDCTPMTHCVPMGWNSWNFWVFRADIFFGAAWCVITTLKMNPRLVEVASISSKIKHVSAKYVLHHIELSLLYLIRFWISSTDGSCFSSSSGSFFVTW